jgi:hypothetical protein
MPYSPEERAAILAAGRQALADADATLARQRPAIGEPPAEEDKLARWKREANEQEQKFARERAASQPLTEFEASRLEVRMAALIDTELGQQKELLLAVMAHSLAAIRDETIDHLEAKIAELTAELGQLRADQTLGEPGGEVIDQPAWPMRKSA